MRTKIERVVLSLILLLLLAGVGGAYSFLMAEEPPGAAEIRSYREIPGITDEEIAAVEALKAARGGFSYGAVPSTEAFMLSDGAYGGFSALFCELLTNLFGVPFTLDVGQWARIKGDLDSGRVDFIGDLTPSSERRLFYQMTHPIAERTLALFTCAREGAAQIELERDLNGLRIGFLKDSNTEESIADAYPEIRFESESVASFFEAAVKLRAGALDGFVCDAVVSAAFLPYPDIRSRPFFSLVYTSVSLSTANPELEPIVSVMDKYIIAGGIDRLHGLYERGERVYAKHELVSSLNAGERAYLEGLAESGAKVRVGLEPDNYPISFYDRGSKQFRGIAADVLAEIGALSGIEFEVANDERATWAEISDKLESHDISLVSQLLRSGRRAGRFLWADRPYFTSRYALLSKLDYPDLAMYQVVRSCVGLIRGSGNGEMFRRSFPYHTDIKVYASQSEALDALERDEIDLLMTFDYGLLDQMNHREKPGYKVNVLFPEPVESSFGLHASEKTLRSILSKAQSSVDTEQIAKYWTSRTYDYAKNLTRTRQVYLRWWAALMVLILIAMNILFAKHVQSNRIIRKQANTITTIYKSIPDMLFCKDVNGAYINCNHSYEIFTGRSEAEIVGRTDIEIFPNHEELALSIMERDGIFLREGSFSSVESWVTPPNHTTPMLLEISRAPLFQDGKLTAFLGVARDVTEHRAAERAGFEASKAKSVFLARMSHEIRTPMNTILGMTELVMREEALPPKARQFLATVKQAGAHMLSIIDDILDFSKIEAGKLEIHAQEFDLISTINDVISITQVKIHEKPLLFIVNIDSETPRRVIGDEMRLKQILLNLLSNAVKYTREGFVALTIHSDLRDGSVTLTIEVSDSGIGIKLEDLKNLFDSFTRFDTHQNLGAEGTGLGLAIVKNLCEAMGGDISVRSGYGDGSTFTVVIPQPFTRYERLAEVEEPERKSVLLYEPRSIYANSLLQTFRDLGVSCAHAASGLEFYDLLAGGEHSFVFMADFLLEADSHLEGLHLGGTLVLLTEGYESAPQGDIQTIRMPAYSFTVANVLNDVAESGDGGESSVSAFIAPSAKILIVDDIETNLAVAEGLLSLYRVQVDTCLSGLEAIERVSRKRYDLIFMDHAMPGMDGIEATAAIRALPDEGGYYRDVPIVALTANAVTGMREVFLQNEMNDFLSKPIEMPRLDAALRKWLPAEKLEQGGASSAVAPSGEPVPFEIDGVETQAGLSMNGGIMANYLKTLDVFNRDLSEKIVELRGALEKNDMKLYTTLVHGLKSASLNIGAKKTSNFAKILEMAGRSGTSLFIMEHNEAFLQELETLSRNIAAAISADGDDAAGEEAPDHAELAHLRELLTRLRGALESMNARQIHNAIHELGIEGWGLRNNNTVKNLERLIVLFQYDEAIALIDSIMSKIAE